MHPAKSVIFFTTASGAGYGFIAWLALAVVFGLVPMEQGFGFVTFGLSLALIVSGLLSSTFHLGHPERAWRAISQWRSSWLSREGVAALLTFAPISLLGLIWVFFNQSEAASAAVPLGLVVAIMALATVYCTAMIYAQLKSIPSWHSKWTPIAYLVFSLMTGSVLMAFFTTLWGYESAGFFGVVALIFLAAGLVTKYRYWADVDQAAPVSTAGTATGLGVFGKVTLIDAPHTDENYLLEEMGFRVARKHAQKLRRITVLCGFVVPFLIILLAQMVGAGVFGMFLLLSAIAVCGVGIAVERWLFFAQAKHVVTLYYGESQI